MGFQEVLNQHHYLTHTGEKTDVVFIDQSCTKKNCQFRLWWKIEPSIFLQVWPEYQDHPMRNAIFWTNWSYRKLIQEPNFLFLIDMVFNTQKTVTCDLYG